MEEVAGELGLQPNANIGQRRRALTQIFCGWHEGMLASLALQQLASETLEATEDEALLSGQAAMLRIAKPLAVFHSQRLRALPESERYFENHQSLIGAASRYFRPSST